MPYVVNAARTLMRQVLERREGADITVGTEVDGLNRIRSVEFDTKTSKWLNPILEACDNPDDFALDEADRVLNP